MNQAKQRQSCSILCLLQCTISLGCIKATARDDDKIVSMYHINGFEAILLMFCIRCLFFCFCFAIFSLAFNFSLSNIEKNIEGTINIIGSGIIHSCDTAAHLPLCCNAFFTFARAVTLLPKSHRSGRCIFGWKKVRRLTLSSCDMLNGRYAGCPNVVIYSVK